MSGVRDCSRAPAYAEKKQSVTLRAAPFTSKPNNICIYILLYLIKHNVALTAHQECCRDFIYINSVYITLP